MKAVYLHGLGSSGSSATAQRLRRSLPNSIEVLSPDIPVQPEMAISFLRRFAAQHLGPDDIIVGTSMGALYAQLFKGWRRILVNPSFHTSRHLAEKIGQRLPFHTPRQDGATDFEVNQKLIKKFEKLEADQFSPKFGIFNPRHKDSPEQVTGFFGSRVRRRAPSRPRHHPQPHRPRNPRPLRPITLFLKIFAHGSQRNSILST